MRYFALLMLLLVLSGCGKTEEPVTPQAVPIKMGDAEHLARAYVQIKGEYTNYNGQNLNLILSAPHECSTCFIHVYEFDRTRKGVAEHVVVSVTTKGMNVTGMEISRIDVLAIPDKQPVKQIPQTTENQKAKEPELDPIPYPEATRDLLEEPELKGLTPDDIELVRRLEQNNMGMLFETYIANTESGLVVAQVVISASGVEDISIVTREDNEAMIDCYERDGMYSTWGGKGLCTYDNGRTCSDDQFYDGDC